MKNGDPRTKDYHVASVEEYIGDSGKEFEGAAEQIVGETGFLKEIE